MTQNKDVTSSLVGLTELVTYSTELLDQLKLILPYLEHHSKAGFEQATAQSMERTVFLTKIKNITNKLADDEKQHLETYRKIFKDNLKGMTTEAAEQAAKLIFHEFRNVEGDFQQQITDKFNARLDGYAALFDEVIETFNNAGDAIVNGMTAYEKRVNTHALATDAHNTKIIELSTKIENLKSELADINGMATTLVRSTVTDLTEKLTTTTITTTQKIEEAVAIECEKIVGSSSQLLDTIQKQTNSANEELNKEIHKKVNRSIIFIMVLGLIAAFSYPLFLWATLPAIEKLKAQQALHERVQKNAYLENILPCNTVDTEAREGQMCFYTLKDSSCKLISTGRTLCTIDPNRP